MRTVVLKSLRQDFVKRTGLSLTVTEKRTHGTPFSMKVLTSTLLNSLTALAIFSSFVHPEYSVLPQEAGKGKTTSEIRVIFRIPCGHSVLAAIDRCIDTENQCPVDLVASIFSYFAKEHLV